MNRTLLLKKSLSALLVLTATLLTAAALIVFNPLEKSQLVLSNFLYHESVSKNPIVIVGIDDKSIYQTSGLGSFNTWRRSYYAKALENLNKYQPSAIGIDILFSERSRGVSEDDLKELTKNPKNLVLELAKYLPSNKIHPDDQKLLDELNNKQNIVLAALIMLYDNNPRVVRPFLSGIGQINLGSTTAFSEEDGITRSIYIGYKDLMPFAIAVIKASSGQEVSLPLYAESEYLINYKSLPLIDELQAAKNPNIIYLSFSDVYNETYPTTFDPSVIKDKIVLIGAFRKTSGDNYLTPIDPQNAMPGVQIHAQAIQTILDQAWLRDMTKNETAIICALLALLSTILIFALSAKIAFSVIILLGTLYLLSARPLFDRGLIINLIYPPITLLTALIIGYTYRFVTEFKQKTLLHTALGRYVNKSVADSALTDPAQLGLTGEKRNITVMFTDIVNFTSISEKLSAQSLVTLLNEYLQTMAGIITKHGGTIDKFEGDAIMAFFGAPTPQQNHAIRACEAALEMRQSLQPLMQKWQNDPPLSGGESKPNIDFRVGISTGDAIIGNIGFEDHIEYTAMGDIVNLGSRLESANKKYSTRVMISEETARQIDDFFDLRFIDVVKVKGKEQPIKTYELQAVHGTGTEKQKDLIAKYHEAVQLYFDRKFIEALDIFNSLLQQYPDDALTNIYASRCEILKRYPPGADWDFVYTMQSK